MPLNSECVKKNYFEVDVLIQNLTGISIMIAGNIGAIACILFIFDDIKLNKFTNIQEYSNLVYFLFVYIFTQLFGYYLVKKIDLNTKYILTKKEFMKKKSLLNNAHILFLFAVNQKRNNKSYLDIIISELMNRKVINNYNIEETFIDDTRRCYYNILIDSKIVLLYKYDNYHDKIIELDNIDHIELVEEANNNKYISIKIILNNDNVVNTIYLQTNNYDKWYDIFQKNGKSRK